MSTRNSAPPPIIEDVKLPQDSLILTVPRSSAFSPYAGQKVVLLGVAKASKEGTAAKRPAGCEGEEAAKEVEVISKEAIVLGEKDEQVVVALTPDEACKAAPCIGDSQLIMLEKSE